MWALLTLGLPAFAVALWAARLLRQELDPTRVPILMYHRFLAADDVASGRVHDPERVWVALDSELDAQCQALADAGYVAVDLDELQAYFAGTFKPAGKPVVLTFDDGYRSCWQLARPVLRRHGMKGVFYIAVRPDAHTRELVQGLDGFMTPEQLRALHAEGHTVASHTMSHGLLSEMSDADVRWELSASKDQLERWLGAPVRHFCIPRAGGDRRVVRLVGEAGYVTSTGADKGGACASHDPLRLPRFGVSRGTSGEALLARLQPHRAAWEHLLADLRLIPTRLLGPRAGYRVRQMVYGGPLRRALFQERLPLVMALGGAVYVAVSLAWLWG